jgi:hypothetical protein
LRLGLAASTCGLGERLDIAGDQGLACSVRVPFGQAIQAHRRRLGIGPQHGQRHQPEAVALFESRQLFQETAAVGAARVDECHHVLFAAAQIQCPQGGGIEAQSLQVDAVGKAGALLQRRELRPVPHRSQAGPVKT